MTYDPILLIDREGCIFSVETAPPQSWSCIHYRDNFYLSFGRGVIDLLKVESLNPLVISEYVGMLNEGDDEEDNWCTDTDRYELVCTLLSADTSSFSYVDSRAGFIRGRLLSYPAEIYAYIPSEEYPGIEGYLRNNHFIDNTTRLRLM